MIDISTEAKMLLMNNRTTLFKADLILNGDIPSAEGKNLDIHENDYGGNSQMELSPWNHVIWGGGYGSDLSQIPMNLVSMYEYIVLSGYIRHNSISKVSNLTFGVKVKESSTKFDFGNQAEVVEGEYQRFIASIKVAELPHGVLDCAAAKYSADSEIIVDIDYKQFMCELNNTGIPSAYADSYVYNGGSYDDFLNPPTMSLTGDDVMANTITYTDNTSSSGSFDIGASIINSLSLTLNNYDDRFSHIDFSGASLRAYIGIPLAETEWITKGYYTVDKPTSMGNTIPLTMLDNMSKFEKPYSEVAQIFPATVSQILQTVCIYCGVVLDNTTFTNSTLSISSRPEDENLSCLDIVSAIAQLAGCYARINNQGYLQMMWYDTEAFNDDSEDYDGGTFLTNTTPYSDGDSLDGGDFSYDGTEDSADGGSFTYGDYFSCYAFSSFSVGTDDITITGIKVTVDSDNYYAVGEDGYVLELSNNPLITAENMESVVQFLGNKIIGMKFRPFNVSALSDPTVEAGDAIRLTDRKGNYYDSFVTSCSYKFGNYESFACNAESVSQRNATNYSPLTKAAQIAKKETQKALSSYDLAVINMNEIAMNALGYYSSYTEDLDGSRISYIHNKLTRAESTIIYMLSSSGFFLSTDGGATYTAGFDSGGNAVFNILNAIGINCDWINAGTLTLGGTGNVNGLLSVLNANGTQVVRADKDGIYATAGTIGGFEIGADRLGVTYAAAGSGGICISRSGGYLEAWLPARSTNVSAGVVKVAVGGGNAGVQVWNSSGGIYSGQRTEIRPSGFFQYSAEGWERIKLIEQELFSDKVSFKINAAGAFIVHVGDLKSIVDYAKNQGWIPNVDWGD